MSESAAELSTGQVFAGWRVERELARGGMGVLYLAHHPRLPRTDVIKVLSPWLSANGRFRERFLREAERMSTLSHPHVMPIHDSGEAADGTLYLVMPYIAGGDLRSLLRQQGALEPRRAAALVGQVAAALDAAHRIGVVHRDVKPENVLLASMEPDDADHALLTDFGISREEVATNTLTATGELLLTPAYAAPEQVLGKATDSRADQYALACILYELLTGTAPYVDEVPVVMLMAHLQEKTPQIAELYGLPAAIDDVIGRAMAKAPEERYTSCREMAKAAAAALGESVTVPSAMPSAMPSNAPSGSPGRPTPPRNPPAVSLPGLTPASTHEPTEAFAAEGLAPETVVPRSQPPAGPPPAAPPPYQPPPPPYQPTPAYQPPYYGGGPQPRKSRKGLWIGIAAAVVVAGAGAGVAVALTSGSSSKPAPEYQALLARLPSNVQPSCDDTTAQLGKEAPFVIARARCTATDGGRRFYIFYRALNGDAATMQRYRDSGLGLTTARYSAGNCKTLTSAGSSAVGTRGYSELVNDGQLAGAVWCDRDGTLFYLPATTPDGKPPIMTKSQPIAGQPSATPEQRYADLVAVAAKG